MRILKYIKKYGMQGLILKVFNKLKNMFFRMRYGAGSMERYFLMKDKYEHGIQNVSWEMVRKYGRLVTAKAWNQEKERERDMLTENIIEGKQSFDARYRREIEYCRDRKECMLYPYAFTEKYLKREDAVQVFRDDSDKDCLKYVLHNGRRLYFQNVDEKDIRHQYTQLVMEQDRLSPHAYFQGSSQNTRGGVYLWTWAAQKESFRWRWLKVRAKFI